MPVSLGDAIRRLSLDANNASNPTNLIYGTVTRTNPLEITVTSNFKLPSVLLIVPERLTDHSVQMTVSLSTTSNGGHSHSYSGGTDSASGGSGEQAFAGHSHGYSGSTGNAGDHSHEITGKKTMTYHNGLRVGDRVALIREQGGRKYFVLDRF